MKPRAPEPAVGSVVFTGLLLAHGIALPLGLGSVAAGAVVARGISLGGDAGPSLSPLATLITHAATYLPIGDLAARANGASAVLGALASALVARVACEVLRAMRPAPRARTEAGGRVADAVAAGGAALIAGLSLGAFSVTTRSASASCLLALVAGGWLLGARLVQAPSSTRLAVALAAIAGLACGAEPGAAPLLWGPGLGLWLWALRRGERWALVTPAIFVAGAGVALVSVAIDRPPPTVIELLRHPWHAVPGVAAARAAVTEAGEQIGVLGLLLAAYGVVLVAVRVPVACAVMLWTVAVGAYASGVPLVAATLALAVPIAAGIAQLAGALGRGRVPAAAALSAMAALAPALDGGKARWSPDVRLPARLLERALDDLPPRASVDPGSYEMRSLFRYGAAVGLRPDITIRPTRRSHP